jgi:hypothetical protein
MNLITNNFLKKKLKSKFSFSREKNITWRKSYKIKQDDSFFGSGYSSKKSVLDRINWSINYDVKKLQREISNLRKLGIKVTIR